MSYTKELEDGLQRLQTELDLVRNDVRLSNGAYAIADANIALLKGENDELRRQLTEANEQLGRYKNQIENLLKPMRDQACAELTASQAREKMLRDALEYAANFLMLMGVEDAPKDAPERYWDLAQHAKAWPTIYGPIVAVLASTEPVPVQVHEDTTRLDWLESKSKFITSTTGAHRGYHELPSVAIDYWCGKAGVTAGLGMTPATLRAAIDAARAKETTP